MDITVSNTNEHIRKIEDIIDIQKANGNFVVRQVAFNLPSGSDSTVAANLARSLESGLSKNKADGIEKQKMKKARFKRQKSLMPDVISWPSDSDITVLRMKLCLASSDLNEKVGNLIPGDGLHQPDSSSMVNLATLMRQSQPPSKHSIIEEYLLPLTSWENGQDCQEAIPKYKTTITEEKISDDHITKLGSDMNGYEPVCSRQNEIENFYLKDGEIYSETSTKSKIARFLRLYFCPCCRCLYKMEKMSDEPSAYWEKRKEQIFQ